MAEKGGVTMFIDTKTIQYLARYYAGELPADGVRFTLSLFHHGKFSTAYKARCILKILYLDNLLNPEDITGAGWNAIRVNA